MRPTLVSGVSVFKGVLQLPVRGADLALNSWSNWRASRVLDGRITASGLDRVGKLVVYTAIFGGKDELIEAPCFPSVDFVCFTDDPKLTSRTWKVVLAAEAASADPRSGAKLYKILPHRFFPDYDCSLWIDGTHVPRSTRDTSSANTSGLPTWRCSPITRGIVSMTR